MEIRWQEGNRNYQLSNSSSESCWLLIPQPIHFFSLKSFPSCVPYISLLLLSIIIRVMPKGFSYLLPNRFVKLIKASLSCHPCAVPASISFSQLTSSWGKINHNIKVYMTYKSAIPPSFTANISAQSREYIRKEMPLALSIKLHLCHSASIFSKNWSGER